MPQSAPTLLVTLLLVFVVIPFGGWGLIQGTIKMKREHRRLDRDV